MLALKLLFSCYRIILLRAAPLSFDEGASPLKSASSFPSLVLLSPGGVRGGGFYSHQVFSNTSGDRGMDRYWSINAKEEAVPHL